MWLEPIFSKYLDSQPYDEIEDIVPVSRDDLWWCPCPYHSVLAIVSAVVLDHTCITYHLPSSWFNDEDSLPP